jgi:hypothetical protein
MKIGRTIAAALAIGALAIPAVGEPDNAPPKAEHQAGTQEGPRHEGQGGLKDDEIRDMVSTIMMVRVSRSLELSDEQTVILVKHMQEMREETSKLYRQRDDVMASLRAQVGNEGATDDEVNAKLQELISIEDKRHQVKKDAFDKISAGFTAKQKAKLFITLQEFEGQMRRMVQRAKEMGEDALREKIQEWNRGDGPPRGPADRPAAKQFMKNRRPGPPPAEGETPVAPETKAE